MRKTIFFLGALLLCACSNKQSINTKELQGTYDIDCAPLFASLAQDEEDFTSLNAVSSVLLSSISFIITFEQEKVIFDTQNSLLWKYIVEDLAHNQLLDDAAVRFAKLFGNQHNQPSVTEYKIVNDSLLYLFNSQENKFEKYGILRKMSENYDYLKCIISTQKESYAPIELTMRKIQK